MNCVRCKSAVQPVWKFCTQCGAPLAAGRSGGSTAGTNAAASPSDQLILHPGATLFDEFDVEEELGRGGFGSVFLVRNRHTGEQYAVKVAHVQDDKGRRNAQIELQNWMSLRRHPHLVTCRFFRTHTDRARDETLLIFAEYVDGDSLGQWIGQSRLDGVAGVLDVAIQTAWGLHAAHSRGLVHQDFKPANVLMTREGVAKVTDFGISRLRALTSPNESSSTDDGVAFAGSTAEYASPEQARKGEVPIDHRSDIWNWGVTFFEMLTGSWPALVGPLAGEGLEDHLRRQAAGEESIRLPEEMVPILHRCFRKNREERWSSMHEVAEELRRVYRQVSGKPYQRTLPAEVDRVDLQDANLDLAVNAIVRDHRSQDGGQWLEEANRQSPKKGQGVLPPSGGGRGKRIAELLAFDEAARVFERLSLSGRSECRARLAHLYRDKAGLHRDMGDIPGALSLYARAASLFEQAMSHDADADIEAAVTLVSAGNLLQRLGRHEESHACFLKGHQFVSGEDERPQAQKCLACCFQGGAASLHGQGKYVDSLELHLLAVACWERLGEASQAADVTSSHAFALSDLGETLQHQNDADKSAYCYQKALTLTDRLFERATGFPDADAARFYLGRGQWQGILGQYKAAIASYDQAIAVLEKSVHKQGGVSHAGDLANTYNCKALMVREVSGARPALAEFERSISLLKRLIRDEGLTHLRDALGYTLMNKALTHRQEGKSRRSRKVFAQAIEVLEPLVVEGRFDVAPNLARVYGYLAGVDHGLGDTRGAEQLLNKSIDLLGQLIDNHGHVESASRLAETILTKVALTDRKDFLDKAIRVLERVGDVSTDVEFLNQLGLCHLVRGQDFLNMGRENAAIKHFDRAIDAWEKHIARWGQFYYHSPVSFARVVRAQARYQQGHVARARREAHEALDALRRELSAPKDEIHRESIENWLAQAEAAAANMHL